MTVPVAATSFSLTATYKGGYTTSKSGTVSQVDLVPNFSLAPNPVLNERPSITLSNLMQKATAATLNSRSYAITPGGGGGTLPVHRSIAANGSAAVPAPEQAGQYTMTVTWNYTDHNGQAQVGDGLAALQRDRLRPGADPRRLQELRSHAADPAVVAAQLGTHPGHDLLPLR